MYTIIDIEGNGGPFREEEIIEIAIYKYDGHRIIDQFISLINPQSDITPFVQRLTKITPKMVITAPKFHEVAKRIVEITENTTLVGHNIDFDYRMLKQAFKRLGFDYSINTIDTIPLAKKLLPEEESFSLGKLVKSLGIPMSDRHRASGDARATLELFKLLMIKDQDSEIIQMHKDEVDAKSYLNKLKELTHNLPHEKGIIYFQNKEGKILHIEFTDNINKFAKKTLVAKASRWETVQQETAQIHYDFTGNKVISNLILASKGLTKNEQLHYGLYHNSGDYVIEKLKKEKEALLKFSSLTQARKALEYIKGVEAYQNPEDLKKFLNLSTKDGLWISSGRTLGEKSFIIMEQGKPRGFGFYELYTQIQSARSISKLKIEVEVYDLENELKLALVKNEFIIQPLPD